MTMKHYLKIGLALVIALGFLTASALLNPEALSARAARNTTPTITATQSGVKTDASIKLPLLPPVTASVETGKTQVEFPPGGSTSIQFPSAGLSLLGTQLQGAGAGSGESSVTQIGLDSYRMDGRYVVNNVNILAGAVTADRIEIRQICDLDGKNLTCPTQSAVFQNLKVNGASMPDQPQSNTVIEFGKQITVGGLPVDSTVKVKVNPASVTQQGDNAEVKQGGLSVEAHESAQVGQMRRKGAGISRGMDNSLIGRLLPGRAIGASYNVAASLLPPSAAPQDIDIGIIIITMSLTFNIHVPDLEVELP